MLHIGKVNGLTSLCECLYSNSTAAAQDAGNYYCAGNFCLFESTAVFYIGWSTGLNAGWSTRIENFVNWYGKGKKCW